MEWPDSGARARYGRDRIFLPGPKRILSIDGSFSRIILSLGLLEAMEQELAHATKQAEEFRLSNYFDLIGSTSFGAIMSSTLALGYQVREVKNILLEFLPRLTRRSSNFLRLPGLFARFNSQPLEELCRDVFGNLTLDSSKLATGIAYFAKRLDTGTLWTATNNPRAPYWSAVDSGFAANRNYLLSQLVAASAAAPLFFDPKSLQGGGIFIDSSLSIPDPSLVLFLLVTSEAQGLRWALGPDQLLIVSIGAGYKRQRVRPNALRSRWPIQVALDALASIPFDVAEHTEATMRALGKNVSLPRHFSSDDLTPPLTEKGLFSYARANASLEPSAIEPFARGSGHESADLVQLSEELASYDYASPDKLLTLYNIGLSTGRNTNWSAIHESFKGLDGPDAPSSHLVNS